MSNFVDRVERNLGHIADRATPSSTAWEEIQTRIAEQAEQPEMEIIMLQKKPPTPIWQRPLVLGTAAAVALIVVSIVFALTRSDGDSNSIRVTDEVSTSTTVTTSPPTTEGPATTAAPTIVAESAASSEADLAVVLDFMEARGAYDGEGMRQVVADDATIVFAHEWIDRPDGYLVLDDFERAHGWQFLDLECAPGSPGRVRCTYTMESDVTRALGAGPYENSLIFDIIDGLIIQVSHNRSAGEGSGGSFFSEVHFVGLNPWLDANHPGDYDRMYSPDSVDNVTPPLITPASIALWEERVPEFVDSLVADG